MYSRTEHCPGRSVLAAAIAALALCLGAPSLSFAAPVAPTVFPPEAGDTILAGTLNGATATDWIYVALNGETLLPPTKVAIDGTWAATVPALEGGDIVWAFAEDKNGTDGPPSEPLTVLKALPAPTVGLPVLTTDTSVKGTYACDVTAFTVSQQNLDFQAYPLGIAQSVQETYAYDAGSPDSAASGLEQSGRATVLLHRNLVTKELSLMVVIDAANDGSGGSAKLTIGGLPGSAELLVADDPAGATSAYNLASGEFTWAWDSCCTAGLALGPMPDAACLTLEFSDVSGLTGVDVIHSSPDGPVRLAMPSLGAPLLICGVPCAEAAVQVTVGGNVVATDQTASPTWSVPLALAEGQQVGARAAHPLYGQSPLAGPYPVQQRTATPTLDSPILDTALSVTGKLAGEPNGTVVTVYRNNTNTTLGTATVSNGAFTLAVLNGQLQAGDVLFAVAKAASKAESFVSSSVVVTSLGTTAVPQIALPLVEGDTQVCGQVAEANGTTINVLVGGAVVANASANNNQWCANLPSPLLAGATVTATAKAPNKATSATGPTVAVQARAKTPVVQTPLFAQSSLVKGSVAEADSTTVVVLVNGAVAGEGFVKNQKWTVVVDPLGVGDQVTAQAKVSGKADSLLSAPVTVQLNTKSDVPVLDLPLVQGDLSISGACEPATGVAILFKNGAFLGTVLVSDGPFELALASALQVGESITAQCQTTGKQTSDIAGPVVVVARTAAPTIQTPVFDDDAAISGTSNDAEGTQITVFRNGASLATASMAAGVWSAAVPSELLAGDQLFATAKADGKAVSFPSNAVIVQFRPLSQAPSISAPVVEGDTTVSGSVVEPAGALIEVFVDGELVGQTTSGADGKWTATVPPLEVGQVVTARAKSPDEKPSPLSNALTVLDRTNTPNVNAPLVVGDSQVTGTIAEIDGTSVSITRNGQPSGNTASAGGGWVVDLAQPLALGDTVCATATAPGKAVSFQSACVTVQSLTTSNVPSITGPLTEGALSVSGTVSEGVGTTITLRANGGAIGTSPLTVPTKWTVNLAQPLVCGDTITAEAKAPGKATSPQSAGVEVLCLSATPTIDTPVNDCQTTITGTTSEEDGSIIRLYVSGNPTPVGQILASGGVWSIAVDTAFVAGTALQARAQAAGKAESAPSPTAVVVVRPTSDAPVLAQPILQLDTEITGSTSEPDGTLITVLLNGVVVGTDTAEDGGFSVVLSAPVEAGDIITATAAAACELESAASTPAVVGYKDTDGDTINDVDEQEGDADDDDTDNFLDLDSDGDGIADSVEAGDDDVATEPVDTDGDGVPDFLDPDSDDDGKPDEEEGTGDQDGDGKPNYIDPDDNDGPLGDADGDTITNEDEDFTDLDTDGDETPDYLDLDSDDDGIPDKTEAGDGDLDTDPVDSDGDETPDFQDEDSDDDGLTDEEETAEDCDGDTVPNYLDLDSDDDGKPDSEEGTDDSDGDGIADFCDPDIFDPEGDDDGDTIKNGDDGQADADGDGKPNYLDTDADGDGVGDAEEAGDDDLGTPPVDTDGDGTPDFLDLDADNDTITDTDEMAEDYPGNVVPNADGDGLPNFRDLDSDGDGLPDAEEAGDSVLETAPIDTDGDGIPNFLDLDSDGDGVPDSLDNCVLAQNADQADSDLDSVGDVCDNCPEFPNADQLDSDLNGVGDVCDIDVLPDEDDGFVGALYGGGGCRTPAEDSRGLGALAALGTAALMLGIRRRRRLRRLTLATGNEGGKQVTLWLAVTLCLSLPSNNAHAQGVNAQNFVPAAGKGNQVVTHGSDTGQHLDFSIGFLADYSKNPLVLVFGDREESVVEHLVTGNFLFSLSTWDFMQFAIGIPVNLALIGTYEGSDLAPATMGDISLDIKFRILDHQKMGGFGLALVPTITFPTGNKDEFSGAGTFGGLLRLVMDYRVWRIHTALNLGYGVQGDGSLRNVSFGSELFFNLGVGYNVIDPLTITAEIWGATRATDPFANDAESPLEGILSIKGAIADGVYLLGGGGAGFSVGVGSPDFRAFIGAGWAPEVRDTDGDGLVDSEDACPLQPEDFDGFEDSDGCPELDNDKDGIPDTSDGCPNEPEDVDGFQDEDGCPDGDNDNDGIADARDKCPRDPEDYDGFEDENGCPDPDNDGDSIPDVVDKCPLQPEVFNGVEDQDGCPDEALIELRDDYIQIKDKVYFDFNKDTIQERSFEMLNQIASLLSGQGNIGLVLVGGHTDGKGSDVYNLNLSQRRADAVVRYLVGRGVAPNRLRGQGFGETQPVAGNDTEEGREKNRRVEFLILEQGQR